MKILFLGDLHADRWADAGRDPVAPIARVLREVDLLVLAGDVHNVADGGWDETVEALSRHVDPSRIVIVPGNHDYYGERLGDDERLGEIARRCGANLLQKGVMTFGDLRVLGCTLWTDFSLGGDQAGSMRAATDTPDCRFILNGRNGGRVTPRDVARVFCDHLAWLDRELSRPWAGRTLVVTHHGASPAVTGGKRREGDAGFVTDLDRLILKRRPDVWMSAHTHRHLRGRVGDTDVRNVSLGYPWEVSPVMQEHVLMAGLVDTDLPGLVS